MSPSNEQNIQIFWQKVELLYFLCDIFSRPGTTKCVERTRCKILRVGGKTRNIAISLSRVATTLRKLNVFVARFTVALAQKVYSFFSGGSRPSDMGGGADGRRSVHPDPEITGGGGERDQNFSTGPSGLSLVKK